MKSRLEAISIAAAFVIGGFVVAGLIFGRPITVLLTCGGFNQCQQASETYTELAVIPGLIGAAIGGLLWFALARRADRRTRD